MKRTLLILLTFFAFFSTKAQIYQKVPGYGFAWDRIRPDSVLHLPSANDTSSLKTNLTTPQIRVVGDSVWWYKAGRWRNLSKSSFDTTSLSNRINLKLNISDTASMLSPYLNQVNTNTNNIATNTANIATNTSNIATNASDILLRVKYSDTASMFSNYGRVNNGANYRIPYYTGSHTLSGSDSLKFDYDHIRLLLGTPTDYQARLNMHLYDGIDGVYIKAAAASTGKAVRVVNDSGFEAYINNNGQALFNTAGSSGAAIGLQVNNSGGEMFRVNGDESIYLGTSGNAPFYMTRNNTTRYLYNSAAGGLVVQHVGGNLMLGTSVDSSSYKIQLGGNSLLKGVAKYATNYGSLFDVRSLVNKGYVDSAIASNTGSISGKLNISDTASMLSPYLNSAGYGLSKSGKTILADTSILVNKAGEQIITGQKSFNGFTIFNYGSSYANNTLLYASQFYAGKGIAFSDTYSPAIYADAQAFAINRYDTISTMRIRRDNIPPGVSREQTFSWRNTVSHQYIYPDASGTFALTSDIPSITGKLNISDTASMLSPYSRDYNTVHKSGDETITGFKTFSAGSLFSGQIYANGSVLLPIAGTSSQTRLQNLNSPGVHSSGANQLGFNSNNDLYFASDSRGSTVFSFNNPGDSRTYTMPGTSGTLALTSQIPSLSGYVQGSGTTNYISKFTGSGTIGNSALQDDGTNIGLGTAPTGYYNTTVKLGTGSNSTGIAFTQSNFLRNEIYSYNNDLYLNSVSGGVNFATQSSNRATINNAGRFLIGATDDGTSLLQVGGAGRFTGALSGTSATFSGSLTAQRGNFYQGASSGFAIAMKNRNANQEWGFVVDTDAVDDKNLGIYSTQAGVYALKIASGGIATFSDNLYLSKSDSRLIGGNTSGRLILSNSDVSSYMAIYGSANSNDIGLVTNSKITFNTGSGYPERMRLSSDGHLGIGTTNPLNKLVVASGAGYNFEVGPGATTGVIAYDRATNVWSPMAIDASKLMLNANTGNNVLIGTSTDAGQKLQVLDNSTSSGEVARFQRNIDANNEAAYIRIGNANYPAYIGSMLQSYDVAYISMVQDPTQGKGLYVRNIDGSTSIGTTQPSSGGSAASWFTMNGTTASNYSGGTIFAYNGSAKVFEYWQNDNFYVQNGTNGVYLATNGTSWASASDIRLKKINGKIENALEKLMSLNAVNFSWKSDKTNKENFGLIAQEVQTVFPQLIDKNVIRGDESNTEYLGVKYTELVPVLIKAIQELKIQNENLQQQILELKNKQ